VVLTQPAGTPLPTIEITQTDFRSSVTWQDNPVPARTSTWGLLKQLYR
jgi:hypothetical protein